MEDLRDGGYPQPQYDASYSQDNAPQRTPRTRQRSGLNVRYSMLNLNAVGTMSAAPRWSFPGKPRTASVDSRPIVPDPGAYGTSDPTSTSKMQRSPRAGFGTFSSSRQVLAQDKNSAIPGPGQYNHQARDDLGQVPRRSSAAIGTPRSRDRPVRESTPDPGAYQSLDPQSTSKMGRSPSYGFASRASRFPMLKERAPGPGSYGAPELSPRNSGTDFNRGPPRQRQQLRPESPDPGTYAPADPSVTSRMTRSPRASLGGAADAPLKEGVPGPGTYYHKETLGDAMAVSFLRSAQRSNNSSTRPHVTDAIYDPADPTLTSRMPKQAAYGFGNLNTGRDYSKSDTNGFDKTDDSMEENGMPINGRVRSPRADKPDVPGPGAYTIGGAEQAVSHASPQWGFGGQEARPRSSQTLRTVIQTPGPGTYIRGSMIGNGGAKFSMRSRSDDRLKDTPGPGAYGGAYTQFAW